MGNVTDFPVRASEDPSWSPTLPHNRYVEIGGIPSKRSMSERYAYFKLVGGELYVEQRREDADDSEYDKLARGGPMASADRDMFSGRGRLVSFAQMPNRYAGLRQYYSRNYGQPFCVDMDENSRAQIVTQRRETVRQMWRRQYEETSEEERAAQELTPAPTEAQIDELMAEYPVCSEAWLIQEGVSPRDYWWYVLLVGMFVAFMLVDAVLLVRWVVRFVRHAHQ